MRLARTTMGDFVPGKFTLPGYYGASGIGLSGIGRFGDFVPGKFAVPGYYGPSGVGMSGLGCGGDAGCGCGPCRGGMGAVDFSPTSTSIGDTLQTTVGMTSPVHIPNWALYGVVAFGAYMIFSKKGRR